MSLVDRSWPLLSRATQLHVWAYRATGGAVGGHFAGGARILLLDHVGARTGARRTTPLLYVRDDPDVVLVASKGGHPRHPAWYHNLLAHPDTTVQIGSEQRPVHARKASPEERARLWPMAVAVNGGYRGYQERTAREIPLMILEPRASD